MANQDFESLLATIQKINKEMSELNAKIAKTRTEISQMKDPAERLSAGRRLGGYVRGAQQQEEKVGTLKGTAESSLQAYNDALKTAEKNIRSLESAELREGAGLTKQLERELVIRRQLSAEVERMSKLYNKANIPNSKTYIPSVSRPTGPGTPANQGFLPDMPEVGRQTIGQYVQDATPTMSEWASKAQLKQRTTQMSEAARLEAERLQALRDSIRADKRYASAINMAEQQGFGLNELKGIRTRGTGGINQLQFEKQDDLGIKRNLDIYSSPSGRATAGISNQFRTFGQGVVRDIGELTKWSIALAAIYGPLQKLQELTQEMIANQTKLAEATITVNSAFTGQAEIFNIAADAANNSGEAISGVIDAFTQAYRATGGVGDQVTRLSTAQRLLADALVLSKLSTLDQAGAIDTLSAAVRQSGQGFGYTTTLLDKWVRVTKVANVDLATLATGFATVADAADTAGLKTDDLNGILATLAESTNQSGQEVANTSRAIIAGFQSDQGVKALEALGIATKDAEGNMRSLKDVIQEVAALRKQGIIDDTQFSKLTLAIGQGTRRQAPTATFIENYDRALAVASESSRAQGDAAAALDKQLSTVQTSLTRLANSFTTLAQTLGMEGGFLSIIQDGVKAMTGLVNIFNSLVGILGKATPALVAFIAASVALKYKGIPSVQAGLGSIFETTAQPTGPGGQPYLPGMSPALTGGQRANNFAAQNLAGTNLSSGAVQGLLLAAIPAIMNATNKEDRFGGLKAGADLAGGLAGGIIGSLTGAGPVIGAAVGTAISEAFINATVARVPNIFGYNVKPTFGEPTKAGLGTEVDRQKALEQAQIGIYKDIGGGSEERGRFLTAGAEKTAKNLIDQINSAIKNQDKGQLEEIFSGRGGKGRRDFLSQMGITPGQISSAFSSKQELTASPEYASYLLASKKAQKVYDESKAAIDAIDSVSVQTPFTIDVAKNRKRFGTDIEGLQNQASADLAKQRIGGEVTTADYARKTTAIGGFDTKALQYYTALGQSLKDINPYIESDKDAFEALSTIIIDGAENSIPELTGIVGEIEDLTNILNDPKFKDPELLKSLTGFESLSKVEDRLKNLKVAGGNILSDIYGQAQLSGIKVPNINGDISNPLTSPENKLVEQRTKQLQDSFYQGFLKLPDAAYDGLKKTFEDFAVTIKDSGDEFYKSVTETDAQFRQAAVKQLQDEGKIKTDNQFGIQQLDITSQQAAGIKDKIKYEEQFLAQHFPQYKQNPEDQGVIYSDYITDVLHGDNLAIKLALEKIVDLNQKQLDGMYNIPEGATFWVPLQAAYYRPKSEGGVGVGGDASASNTSALDANTKALQDMALAFRGDTGQSRKVETDRQAASGFRGDRGYSRKTEYDNQAALGYRGDPGFSRSAESQPFIQQLLDGLKNFFNGLTQLPTESSRGYHGAGTTYPGTLGSRDMSNVAPQQIQARLDMRFENSVQLLVDGKVLASVITPYLASDLIKMEASQGTITRRYII